MIHVEYSNTSRAWPRTSCNDAVVAEEEEEEEEEIVLGVFL